MTTHNTSEWNSVLLFLAVGFLGFCINMGVLTVALWNGADVHTAIILGITASTLLLFFLDRHLVFSHARHKSVAPQLIGFLAVCFIGGVINYYASTLLLNLAPGLLVQIAEGVGLIIGAIFNYLALRFLIFAKE